LTNSTARTLGSPRTLSQPARSGVSWEDVSREARNNLDPLLNLLETRAGLKQPISRGHWAKNWRMMTHAIVELHATGTLAGNGRETEICAVSSRRWLVALHICQRRDPPTSPTVDICGIRSMFRHDWQTLPVEWCVWMACVSPFKILRV
jgi:hypothetical protein